ncbi:odorant receptor 94b [Drosophila albomicans]|uniref:Odorant receptor n=1 Tax=Drosophila albomicans TaxID=7291 RepID=A0A6P8Y2K2_DROAB|nr:odorant receptor 94b [Drosophila albomicans]
MSTIEFWNRPSPLRNLLKLQRLLGLWKWQRWDENDAWNWLKRFYPFALHLPLTFTLIVLTWLEILTSNDLEQTGRVIYMALTMLPLLIKLINIWYRRIEAHHFMDELMKCIETEDVHLLKNEEVHFKRIFYAYLGGALTVALFGFVSVFLQDTYELPFSYYVPFEWRNPERYLYAWGYNVLAMTLSCTTNSMLDTMGCYFMFQIGLLYRFLNIRLLALQQKPEHEALPELRRIFQRHARVRLLTRQCELLVSPYVLSQVVLSAFIICFSGYRLVQMGWQENPGLFLATLQFEAVMIVQIFLPCYYGNQLTINANQLTNSVFNTNWLEYSVKTRKELICYMEFLKRPVKVRAGIFFEIGLPIFMKTINNAYSFFALLLNLSR